MAVYGSDQVAFAIVGGYDILSNLTQFTDKISAQTEESHTLGTSWVAKSFVNVRSGEWSIDGFFDDAQTKSVAALSANLATSPVLTYAVEGNTAGKHFVGFSGALETDFQKSPSRGALTKIKANFAGNGIVEEGLILLALGSKTTTGISTAAGVDFGTSNTSGGAAYLQVTAFTSGPSTAVQVDVMHSADNLTYTSWAGFTSATAAPFSQRKASAAKLERYGAVRWQGASAGASFPTNVTFFVGLARS